MGREVQQVEMEADRTEDAVGALSIKKVVRSLRTPSFYDIYIPLCSHFLPATHKTTNQQGSPLCGFT